MICHDNPPNPTPLLSGQSGGDRRVLWEPHPVTAMSDDEDLIEHVEFVAITTMLS
jgi:hypothetical protein